MVVKKLALALLLCCLSAPAILAAYPPVTVTSKISTAYDKNKRSRFGKTFNRLSNLTVNRRQDDDFSISGFWQGPYILVNWTALSSRPDFTDTYIIFLTSNPYWVASQGYIGGGTGDSFVIYGSFDPGNYTIQYLENGTDVVASDNFNVD